MKLLLVIYLLSIVGPTFSAINNVKDLVLPTEVNDLKKVGGAIYYSPGAKKSALMPANIWGEIKNAGLHYIPQNTSLINGLSLAGGTTGNADLDSIKLSRYDEGKWNEYKFDLSSGSDTEALNFSLKAGDVIYVQKERYYENRAYYTTLASVLATIVSSLIIYNQVRD